MKTKTDVLTAAAFSILLFGCGSGTEHKHADQKDSAMHDAHHHDAQSGPLEMNDGKKWKVNPEMMVHVQAMEAEIKTFSAATEKDYNALAVNLQTHTSGITSSCTMEGKSHDELHKWLLPHIELIKELKAESDKTKAEAKFHEIEKSMETFHAYFE